MTALLRKAEDLGTQLARRSANLAIRRDGFIEVAVNPYALSQCIDLVRGGMQAITDDPHGLQKFPWRNLVEDAYGPKYAQEVGLKTTKTGDSESKWTFHYSYGIEASTSGPQLIEHAKFFDALRWFDHWSLAIALKVAQTFDAANRIEQTYPGSMVQRLQSGTRVIRVLRYRKKEDDKPDATMHVDRSLFTIHAWSSHAGLRIRSPDHTVCSIQETSCEAAAVFPGEKYAAVTRGAFGFGTPHGVRDERRATGIRQEDRYAIVCFVHPETQLNDAEWLKTNRHLIEAYEATFTV
jgi:hypothetical protein